MPTNPKMNLNHLQISSNLILTQLQSELFLVTLMHKQNNGLGKTTYEGPIFDYITSHFGLEQLIHQPTHIIGERSSCIDSIFASKLNLVMESGIQSFLHQNYYNQKVFKRFNLRAVLQKANNDHIRMGINGFQWEKLFQKYEHQ